jgi:hypothetical protein
MSNDKSNENAPKPQLTRIPLDQAWFTGNEGLDFPGGNAITHSLVFGQPKVKGRQYFLGYFVPSYQVVDIEYYRGEEEPEMFSVPMSAVRKIKRSTKKP